MGCGVHDIQFVITCKDTAIGVDSPKQPFDFVALAVPPLSSLPICCTGAGTSVASIACPPLAMKPRRCNWASTPMRSPKRQMVFQSGTFIAGNSCGLAIGIPPTFAPIAALQQIICQRSQFGKVNVTGYDLQRIPKLIELTFAAAISKQVELQGTTWGDHDLTVCRPWIQGLRGGFERCPSVCIINSITATRTWLMKSVRKGALQGARLGAPSFVKKSN